ncbi:MAG: twin-arginine translocase TatA/TatE family subunit [Ignavibacteriales bacterium]|jgi:sec-independent protein translocase protein TatA|nr:twin-arginine translocase TatA/TatE family subunit [Ignavibacteriaceae bacterium]NLH60357.1 twin-arginine translocase TatA/TatE family subunit [Ignavibacteriales bacterium]HOJ18144.1 twin-arginine translocase TatA/TatE family subunit [Ignavibacteriaceae bacterium]HPO56977.1 twin-arginine translocase TatA/TatE family subunit [Ignavibacteriaceae bacterium]
MFSNLGVTEILIIALVLILLFGAKKIPELAQGIGKGLKEFKKSVKETDDDINRDNKSNSK